MSSGARGARRKSPERPHLTRHASTSKPLTESTKKRDFDDPEPTVTFQDTPKQQLEAEKANLQKAQRANERLMKRMEEVTVRSATKEAEFRLKERDFRDRETRLLGDLEKTEKEITRAKEEIRTQTAKIEARLATKDQDFDKREEKKANLHAIAVKDLKNKIEEAKKAVSDTAKVLKLEAQVREIQDEIRVISAENRKIQGDNQEKLDEIKATKDNITKVKDKLKELDDGQIQMSGVAAEKKKLTRELEDFQKELKEIQQNMVDKDEAEDVWSLKGDLRNAQAACDDLTAQKEKLNSQIDRVKSGLTVDRAALAAVGTGERKYASRETPSTREREREVPAAREYTRSPAATGAAGRTGALAGYDKSKYERGVDTGRKRADEPTRQEKQKIQDLNASLKEYNTRTGNKNRTIQQLESDIAKQQGVNAKLQATLKAAEEEQNQIQKLIKQEKEFQALDVKTTQAKIDLIKASQAGAQAHLAKLQKALKDRQFEMSEDAEKQKQVVAQNGDKKTELRQLESAVRGKESIVSRGERDLQANIKVYRDTIDKLVDTEDKRANTQQVLEETQIEYIEVQRDFQSEIHCLEREIYDQTEAKEFMEKVVFELQKEHADLIWYFKPHVAKEPKESKIHGTAEYDLVVAKRASMNEDLMRVSGFLALTSIETEWKRIQSSPAELKKVLLGLFSEHSRKKATDDSEDFIARIQELYEAMMRSGKISSVEAYSIVVLLTKEDFYPGVLQFLKEKVVEEGHKRHFLSQIKSFLTSTYRSWRASEIADEKELGESFEPTTFRRYFKDCCVRQEFIERNRNPRYRENFEATVLAGTGITERDEVEFWMRQAIECWIWTGDEVKTKEDIEDILG